MFITPTILIYCIASGLVIALAVILHIQYRIRKLFCGKKNGNMEESIAKINKDLVIFEKFQDDVSNYLKTAEARVKRSVQGVATVRFNPFKGTGSGGNQSFATAFINENGDGVVISSLYSHERVSTFGKPLANFKSEYELTEEELQAINFARKDLKK